MWRLTSLSLAQVASWALRGQALEPCVCVWGGCPLHEPQVPGSVPGNISEDLQDLALGLDLSPSQTLEMGCSSEQAILRWSRR